MSGLLGPNTFRADYATTRVAGRSRCKKCRTMFHAGDVRVGKRPPRVREDVPAVRVHWYHPACIFKSFERAAYKTKTLERVGDVEGFDNLRDADRADLAARIAAWSARRAAQLAHYRPKKGRGKKRKVTSLPDALPSMVDDEAGFRAACGLLAAGLEADAPPSKKGGVLGFLARKKRRSDPVPMPSTERRSARARTPKVIVDLPSKGGPGMTAPAPSCPAPLLTADRQSPSASARAPIGARCSAWGQGRSAASSARGSRGLLPSSKAARRPRGPRRGGRRPRGSPLRHQPSTATRRAGSLLSASCLGPSSAGSARAAPRGARSRRRSAPRGPRGPRPAGCRSPRRRRRVRGSSSCRPRARSS